jgi:antitoxin ParD1/3/4
MFEFEESRKAALIKELEKREESGFAENFNRKDLLESLHQRYLTEN